MSACFARHQSHAALDRLSDKRLLRENAYCDGRWVREPSGAAFPVTDPATGTVLAHVSTLGAETTARAIDAAQAALKPWQALAPQARAATLMRWHDLILAARDDLALIMTLEQGKPLAEAKGEPEILMAEVDLARSEHVRRIWPFLRDRRIDAYGDLTRRYRD